MTASPTTSHRKRPNDPVRGGDPETYHAAIWRLLRLSASRSARKLDGSPRFADIVDGKLYLFLNAAVFENYKLDRAGTIAKAERNWPGMEHRPVLEVNS